MMTPVEFVRLFGAKEIADRARPVGSSVPADLLIATVAGTDRSAWTAQQQADADTALRTIEDHLRYATAMIQNDIDAHDPRLAAEAVMWVGKMARFGLYDDTKPPHVQQDGKDYHAWIKRREKTRMSTATLMRA